MSTTHTNQRVIVRLMYKNNVRLCIKMLCFISIYSIHTPRCLCKMEKKSIKQVSNEASAVRKHSNKHSEKLANYASQWGCKVQNY